MENKKNNCVSNGNCSGFHADFAAGVQRRKWQRPWGHKLYDYGYRCLRIGTAFSDVDAHGQVTQAWAVER